MSSDDYRAHLTSLQNTIEDLKATNLLLRKDNHNLTEALYGSYKRIKEFGVSNIVEMDKLANAFPAQFEDFLELPIEEQLKIIPTP